MKADKASEFRENPRQWFRWELKDNISPIPGMPLVTDPDTGKTVDPTGLYLTYLWNDVITKWVLAHVEVHGSEISEDGTYPNYNSVECEFYDPTSSVEADGGFPVWAVEYAARRIARLPAPPTIPEGFDD